MGMVWFIPALVMTMVVGVGTAYRFADRERCELDSRERARLGGTYASLPSGVTHYELTGPEDGPVVVLVHGVTIPQWTWDRQVPVLTAAGFRVLRYDLFGRGRSDRPPGAYSRRRYREQLTHLLDFLHLETPVDLVGHSFGAMIAADFTAFSPARVGRLVVVSPPNDPIRDRTPMGSLVRVGRIPLVGRLAMRLHVVPLSVRRVEGFVGEAQVDRERYLRLYREQIEYRGFERAFLSLFRGDAVGDYSRAYRRAGEGRDVLIIWGNRDTNVSRERAEEVCRAIPHAVFRELNDVGHQPHWQVPVRFNDIVVRFLGGEKRGERL
jgi:pimeloyl-ACP methyl ester carboxylesterase